MQYARMNRSDSLHAGGHCFRGMAAMAVLLLLFAGRAAAETVYTGILSATATNWTNVAWSPVGTPGAPDSVILDLDENSVRELRMNEDVTVVSFTRGSDWNNDLRVNATGEGPRTLTASTITVNERLTLRGDLHVVTSAFNINSQTHLGWIVAGNEIGSLTVNGTTTVSAALHVRTSYSTDENVSLDLGNVSMQTGGIVNAGAVRGTGIVNTVRFRSLSGTTGTIQVGTETGDYDPPTAVILIDGETNAAFSGTIQNGSGGGALSLRKEGGNTQTLSGTNTYTGSTTILGGVLRIGGSSNLTNTSQLGFGVNDDGTSGQLDVETDQFAFSGKPLHLTLSGVTVNEQTWTLFTGSEFGGLSLSGVTSDIDGLTFAQGSAWSGTDGDGRTWSFDEDAGVLSVIPEPSSVALLLLAAGGLVLRRRWKKA